MRYPFNGTFPITQLFGVNQADYAKFGMKGHNGIDFGLPSGTPVVAAESGTVAVLEDPPGFGHYIQLTGYYRTIYAHLDHAIVPNGTQVSEGQQIAVSDNSGNSTGPHLHFGVKPLNPDNNNGFFGAIDPQLLLNQGGQVMVDRNMAIDLGVGILGRSIANAQQQDYLDSVVGQPVDVVIRNLVNSPEGNAFRAKAANGTTPTVVVNGVTYKPE